MEAEHIQKLVKLLLALTPILVVLGVLMIAINVLRSVKAEEQLETVFDPKHTDNPMLAELIDLDGKPRF